VIAGMGAGTCNNVVKFWHRPLGPAGPRGPGRAGCPKGRKGGGVAIEQEGGVSGKRWTGSARVPPDGSLVVWVIGELELGGRQVAEWGGWGREVGRRAEVDRR
jgi:hypothetical protein